MTIGRVASENLPESVANNEQLKIIDTDQFHELTCMFARIFDSSSSQLASRSAEEIPPPSA